MQKIVFNQSGAAKEVLELKEIPTPEVKAGQVGIRVKSASVNPADVLFIQGQYGLKPKFPDSPVGMEGAGEIDKIGTGIGDGIELFKGMRVAFATLGSWSDYVVVPASSVMPLPKNVSWEEGAQFFVNPFTALAMLEDVNLKKGDWLLLTAAYAALNKIVIRIARERGIKTICTVRRDEQVDALHMLGAEAVIHTEKDQLTERVHALTNGRGVQACFESVGGELCEQAINCMGHGGKMLIYGVLSGKPTSLNGGLMIFKELNIKGFWLSRWMQESSTSTKARLSSELYQLAKNNVIPLEAGATFPLKQAAKAVEYSQKSGKSGKAIITCN
ncbi:NADPH:quinone reductase-like Zn-dependent oxidoreductase [Catalinimonas alkaloidigena]|uniref:quinone oxidoreductase family protein n=1 Tax=Catalinimonas alkaloidigena TaxID=1075417 RepID=UPI002406C4A9|nr:zinc-dependent alcohol dehydrogenase family protein [Catalinimonas alkaloidigena]MDF9801136.1 NADPH:quinone reductase-like Zn-dependent oxidoreductase [Catalinimonas alkaloidigena]